jgi:hypothetical protein
MTHALTSLAVLLLTLVECGPRPPNSFPDGRCEDRAVVGEVAIEQSSCMMYSAPASEYGPLRSGVSGELSYNCAGGYAQLSFAERNAELGSYDVWSFWGELVEGAFDLNGSDYFAHEDCVWESRARITGSAASGLHYVYEEHLTERSSPDCAPGCRASAPIRVE